MLLYLFITCLSFLFFKSLPVKPLLFPPWACEMRLLLLLSRWGWKELSVFWFNIKSLPVTIGFLSQTPSKMTSIMSIGLDSRKTISTKHIVNIVENEGEAAHEEICVLDLPELVLECILEKLPPKVLFRIRGVCSSLRERCVSDHLWEKHMKKKWSGIIGPAAYREWQWQSMANYNHNQKQPQKAAGKGGFMRILSSVSLSWALSWIRLSNKDDDSAKHWRRTCFPSHNHEISIMSWYLALETGRFWFPAQVYNRENGHVGFVLSCYDAELSYDPRTDTFQARYPPHGRRAVAVENCVPWERLRAPPIDTPPHDLHISDCLNDLRPGDHIEIQWRRNKEFPYGWWYGIVGHLESCDGNETYCLCHNSDNVVLEFNQYAHGSRWRCTTINRKNHREEGDEADGFYGGVHKLRTKEEISMWKRLWPAQVLE